MTKVELLQIYLDRENHNFYCFEKGSVERTEYAEKIKLLEEMIVLFNNGVLDDSKNVVGLPLDDGTTYVANAEIFNNFSESYPKLDITEQFLKMRGWLIANPSKRKNKISILRFINTWLSYEDKARKKSEAEENGRTGSSAPTKGIYIKPGPMNNFTQELPDFDRITKDIINKMECGTH